MFDELRTRRWRWHRDAAVSFLVMVLALAVRLNHLDFNSLSEDESAKWAAVQQYRQGHFAGVNSEHPMMLKLLAWASLTAGEHWNRVALLHRLLTMSPEGWLRFPNAILGGATASVLFLFCRCMMGFAGSFAASFFWAVSPLAIALNRLAKEETPLTFFTLLACYLYYRAQQAEAEVSARHWYDLSAIAFGLSFASQYIPHLLGLNALAWLVASRMRIHREPSRFSYKRFLVFLLLTFVVVNPVVLFPRNFFAILHWLHHDGVTHSGYDFDGMLYLNYPSRLFAGVPWKFYLWLLLVKTPIPILAAVIIGSVLLLRDRRSLAACFFLTLGVVQLAGLSISGAKWIRYSLPVLPFLFLAGGYAVEQTWNWATERKLSPGFVGTAALILLGWPILALHQWSPYYPFYLNPIGGGEKSISRYFAPDEVSEFDTREVAQQVCPSAPIGARLATARPMSMTYYIARCGRKDIQVVPLYDARYTPREGDLIVLEPSRRFFETQRFFDTLGNSAMPRHEVHVGPVLASTIFLFDSSGPESTSAEEPRTQTGLFESPPRFETTTHVPDFATMNTVVAFERFQWRKK